MDLVKRRAALVRHVVDHKQAAAVRHLVVLAVVLLYSTHVMGHTLGIGSVIMDSCELENHDVEQNFGDA